MRKPKVIVVGAGPSGGACALSLARTGRFETLLVDKSQYPRVKVCGSGLSPHALQMLDRLEVRPRFAGHHGVIDKMVMRGPEGSELMAASGVQVWVVPRVELDQGIARAAVEHGAEFRESTKVTELLRASSGRVVGIRHEGGEIEADLVICADGSPSRFSGDERPKTTIRTLMGWWRGTPWQGRTAHMFWDRRLAGYYAWMFPEPDDVVNIGLTIPEGAGDASRLKGLFQDLLDEHWGEGLRGAEQVGKWMGHPAVISTRVGAVAESHAMWIGEAARLVSPGTVEGIGFALESGILGADTVARAFDAGRGFTSLQIAGYRARLTASMTPKFLVGEAVARAMQSPVLRRVGDRVLHGPMGALLNRAVTLLFGDNRHEATG